MSNAEERGRGLILGAILVLPARTEENKKVINRDSLIPG
jgi:hypothetical protein